MFAEEFAQMLDAAPGKLADASFRGPLEQSAKLAGKAVEGNFVREEDRDGNPWKPHAALTIALYGEHPLLRLSYDMFHAATDPDDPNAKKIVGDRDIVFGIDGTEIPYARKQQSGSGRIPAREFFYLREEDQEAMRDQLAEDARPIIERDVLSL